MKPFTKQPDLTSAISAFAEKQNVLEQRISFLECEQMRSRRTSLLAAELTNIRHAIPKDAGGRILVAGWYGADNLGDELMLRAVLEHFSDDALRRTSVLLWDNSTYNRLKLNHLVHTIHYPATTRELDFLVDCFDIVIWGGGAILDETQFNDDANNINTGNLFIRINELMLSRGRHVFCLGLSTIPELVNDEYINRLSRIIEKADHFSLRDKNSLDSLTKCGINPSKLTLCNDLAFSLSRLAELKRPERDSGKFVAGFVPFYPEIPTDTYEEIIFKTVKEAEKALGNQAIEVLLIPFLNEGHFDEIKNEELQKRLQARGLCASAADHTYCPKQSPILSCDAVISYKYHAALLACCFGIPCLMVSQGNHLHYPNKMNHLAELANVPSAHISNDKLASNPTLIAQTFFGDTQRPRIPKQTYCQAKQYLEKICAEIESL